ncbi:MAG TPA: putative PEP-binding protein [Halomicronema sp.]
MENFYWLGQIEPSQRQLVGEKAFYLNQLLKLGYPVVPGFVVGANVLREFWQNHKWQEPLFAELPYSSLHLNVEDTPRLSALAKKIRQEITKAELPAPLMEALNRATQQLNSPVVIFRPSVVSPLAAGQLNISGLLESHACRCTSTEIATALKQAWAELFRARSLYYWNRAGIELQQIGLAILAQPVWPAVAAGQMLLHAHGVEIEATWGLGHALRLGHAIPDLYHIELASSSPIHRRLGQKTIAYYPTDTSPSTTETSANALNLRMLSEQQQNSYSLEPPQLEELSQLAQKLDLQIGSPSILEWAFIEQDIGLPPQIYLTQAQPTLSPNLKPEASISAKKPVLPTEEPVRGIPASPGISCGPAHVITSLAEEQSLDNIPPGRILIAPAIPPHWQHFLKRVAGVVTEEGGMTCHAAILARELGIPAVVGAKEATHSVETGSTVLVDGNSGLLYLHPPETDILSLSSDPDTGKIAAPQSAFAPSPVGTRLFVNLSQPQRNNLTDWWVDGVGLLRSELLLMELLKNQPSLPFLGSQWIEEIVAAIEPFAAAFAPRPVFYRSLDLRNRQDVYSSGMQLNAANSTLGVHGTFSYTLDPSLFDLELQALGQLQRAGYSNLNLILPFVRSVEEFIFCRHRVEAAGLTVNAPFKLWVMVEVPSLVFLLPDLIAAGVDGFAIGSNDLTQLLLAANREDPQMAVAFDERNAAVLRAFEQIITTAKKAGIPCNLCGAGLHRYPEIIDKLIRWGITGISVEPDALRPTQIAIAKAEQRLFLEVARQQLKNS